MRRRAPGVAVTLGLLVAVLAPGELAAKILVRLSPTFVEVAAAPGRQVADRILYVNAGTHPVTVKVELSDFDVDEKGKAVEQPPGVSPTSLAPFIRISPTEARVAPGGSVYFRYRIDAPAQFEQLRAMVYFVSRPIVERAAGTSALVVPRMGIPIYLENGGATPADLVITRGTARAQEGRVVFDVRVENRGSRNLRPAGAIQIETEGGPRFFQFNEGRSPVLPGHAREWTLQLGPLDAAPRSLRLRLERAPAREVERVFEISAAPSAQRS